MISPVFFTKCVLLLPPLSTHPIIFPIAPFSTILQQPHYFAAFSDPPFSAALAVTPPLLSPIPKISPSLGLLRPTILPMISAVGPLLNIRPSPYPPKKVPFLKTQLKKLKPQLQFKTMVYLFTYLLIIIIIIILLLVFDEKRCTLVNLCAAFPSYVIVGIGTSLAVLVTLFASVSLSRKGQLLLSSNLISKLQV